METLRYLRAEDLPTGDQPVPLGGLDITPILGTWCNTDEATAGVVRMVLTRDGQRLLVRAFGAGAPEPDDWGEVPATAYGASSAVTGAMGFSAVYDLGFVTSSLAAYAKQGILVLDALNSFHDSSGRADYFTREFFHR